MKKENDELKCKMKKQLLSYMWKDIDTAIYSSNHYSMYSPNEYPNLHSPEKWCPLYEKVAASQKADKTELHDVKLSSEDGLSFSLQDGRTNEIRPFGICCGCPGTALIHKAFHEDLDWLVVDSEYDRMVEAHDRCLIIAKAAGEIIASDYIYPIWLKWRIKTVNPNQLVIYFIGFHPFARKHRLERIDELKRCLSEKGLNGIRITVTHK